MRFEAINAGRSGILTPDIQSVVRNELLVLEPDLVVYYEGSNGFWPVEFIAWPDGKAPPLPKVNFVQKSWLESYSALLRRVLTLVDASYHGAGAEPNKVPCEVN